MKGAIMSVSEQLEELLRDIARYFEFWEIAKT